MVTLLMLKGIIISGKQIANLYLNIKMFATNAIHVAYKSPNDEKVTWLNR